MVAQITKSCPSLTVLHVKAWADFLHAQGTTSSGVWLTLARRNHSDPTSLTKQEALEEALCHGWIDGQAGRFESAPDAAYTQRFTPRTSKSLWSKRNVELVEMLEKENRMLPAGRSAVDAAKADGRWERAYERPSRMLVPDDFRLAIEGNDRAARQFETVLKGPKYLMCMQLQNLKTEVGRRKKIETFVDALARGETPCSKASSTASGTVKEKRTANPMGVTAAKDAATSTSKRVADTKLTAPSRQNLHKTRSGRVVRPVLDR